MYLGEDIFETPDNINQRDIESGKLPIQPSVIELNSLSAAKTQISTVALLHVRDELSGTYFLVDTGAEVSIVPPTKPDLSKPPGLDLIAANGSRIM